jgi:hypothetical protein
MKQRCPLSPLIFNIVLEFLARAIKQEKAIKMGTNRKGRNQIMSNCRSYALKTTRKLLALINTFGKVAGYKINI